MSIVPEQQLPESDRSAVLRRTPEQIADDKDAQDAAAKRLLGNVVQSVAMIQYRAAVASEPALTKAVEKSQWTDGSAAANDRLAECYFWQGKFDLAARTAANPAKKLEYGEFANAFVAFRTEVPLCSCPDVMHRRGNSAKGVGLSPRREVQRVYVNNLKAEVKFIKCESCKKLFVQPA